MVNSADRLVVLRLVRQDWEDLWALTEEANADSFTHNLRNPATTPVRRVALICADDALVALGFAQKIQKSTKIHTKVLFTFVQELETPLDIAQFVSELPSKSRVGAGPILGSGGVLPPVAGQSALDTLRRLRPESSGILQRLFEAQAPEKVAMTPHRQQLLAEQRDALALGLEVAGINSRAAFKHWQVPTGDAPFLAGLPDSSTSEASLIRHDSTLLDGWTNIGGTVHDILEIQDPEDEHRKVTVIYADKEPLERLLGTDLVYYRHNNPGFVAVQYKRMRREATQDDPNKAVYRPDDQLIEEIDRMRKIDTQANSPALDSWRLSTEPFYVKLCDGLMRRAENNKLVTGMYFPLSLFEILLESSNIVGPRGGKAIGYHNAERYLSNGEFIELLKHGWIGSVGDTTDEITKVVNAALDRSRSVTLVIDETDTSKARKLPRR